MSAATYADLATVKRRRNVVKVAVEVRGSPGRLYREGHGEIVIAGPAGTGKTRAILEYIHWRCSRERLRVLFIRKTQESLKSSALVTFREQVLHEFDGKESKLDHVRYFGGNAIRSAQFQYDRTGSVIELTGMDRPTKIASTEWDVIYVNEVNELTVAQWESLGGRTDRPSLSKIKAPSLLLGDCNPDAPNHWIRRRATAGLLELWDSRHEDNPAMYYLRSRSWTDSGTRYLARLDRLTGVRYLRNRLGKWAAAEGQVLDRWDRNVHLISRDELESLGFSSKDSHVAGVDWGWTKPGVMDVWRIGNDGQMALVHEVYQTRRAIDWWAAKGKALNDRYHVDTWLCDPSEPANIAALVSAELNAVGAQNAILPGVQLLQARLIPENNGRPRLYVVNDALEAIDDELDERGEATCSLDEIDSWIWAKDNGGRKEKPVDENNHAMDTWRYVAMHLETGASWDDIAAEVNVGAFLGGR